jgi:site-specific DNA-methyltransferase (adenine-specific)
MTSEVYNEDCRIGMARYPDKYFDLAIVDPPYGIGVDGQKLSNTNKNPKHNRKYHEFKGWDNEIPTPEYFRELFRVSKHQIIWGGNYFTDYLYPVKAWIFWYKGQQDLTMSDGELAWTSFDKVTRQITINRFAIKQDGSIHPAQKPVRLYEWLLRNYAKDGDKILDTHLGSGSSRIACSKGGFDFVGFELDKDYYEAQEKRFREFRSQLRLEL